MANLRKLEYMTEPELRELMNATGKAIVETAERLNVEKPLFVLLLFNDPEVAQYVANCERSDVITALREAAERLQRKQDVTR